MNQQRRFPPHGMPCTWTGTPFRAVSTAFPRPDHVCVVWTQAQASLFFAHARTRRKMVYITDSDRPALSSGDAQQHKAQAESGLRLSAARNGTADLIL